MKVYVVVHDFYSHDMFAPESAQQGNPEVFGVFSTRTEAQKHIRPNMDDFVQTFIVDRVKR